MHQIVYPFLIHPHLVRKELKMRKVRHMGISYMREPAQTMVSFRAEPDERTVQVVDSVIQLVAKQTGVSLGTESVSKRRKLQPIRNTPLLGA